MRQSRGKMAEREGFEPPCPLRDKTLSRRPRYDHFGTSPQREISGAELPILPYPGAPLKGGYFAAQVSDTMLSVSTWRSRISMVAFSFVSTFGSGLFATSIRLVLDESVDTAF